MYSVSCLTASFVLDDLLFALGGLILKYERLCELCITTAGRAIR